MLVNQGVSAPWSTPFLCSDLIVGSIPPVSERFTPQRYSRVSLGSVVSLGSSEFRWKVAFDNSGKRCLVFQMRPYLFILALIVCTGRYYRLSHATTSAYRTHTSPVGHSEQRVLSLKYQSFCGSGGVRSSSRMVCTPFGIYQISLIRSVSISSVLTGTQWPSTHISGLIP